MGSITEISACGSPGRRELLAEDSGSEDEDTSEFGSEGERARKRPRARTGRTPDAKQRRIEFRDLREAMKKVHYDGHYKTAPASIILYRIAAAQQDCGLPILWAACVAGHLDSGSMSEAFYREMSHQVYHQFAQEFDNTSADAQPPRPQSTTGDGGARPAPQREGVRTSSQRRRAFFDGFDIIRSNDPGGVRSALLRGLNMLRQVVAQMLSDALADLATKLHSAIEMRITEMGDELEERRARRESGSRKSDKEDAADRVVPTPSTRDGAPADLQLVEQQAEERTSTKRKRTPSNSPVVARPTPHPGVYVAADPDKKQVTVSALIMDSPPEK
ncbi:hypothetical protein FOZ62_029749 [Perkinsus olseni]|uniref:Uncharacterized protein n=1 Tax=Perkinsus olseni TaxID=32597 RepID=A0A7J6RLU1_PEROL|nr:hypothetical protein FOZ62_029749 [Perkinsus olseni]